jgi:hypothetical protein
MVVWALFLVAAGSRPVLAAQGQERSLREAFAAFAACASEDVQSRLAKSTDFLSGKSEDELRQLPSHIAHNEQESVLALQQALLPPGAAVSVLGGAGLGDEISGCEGIVISCLRDGSFRCVVELRCDEEARAVRVHTSSLRPVANCAFRWPSSCIGTPKGAAPTEPLTKEAVGKTIALGFQQHEQLAADSQRPRAELGPTAFPDLSYSALIFVLLRLHLLGCAALQRGDSTGARLALEQALDLEIQAAGLIRSYECPSVLVRSHQILSNPIRSDRIGSDLDLIGSDPIPPDPTRPHQTPPDLTRGDRT